MAMLSHRLRRVFFAVPYCFQRSFSLSRASDFPPVPSLFPRSVVRQSAEFGRSPARLFSTTQYQYDPYTGEDSFTPDNEGCDFNHWLITMDFPKENPPSREEMISIFEQTCAKGLDISLEEAKKKIYAICTTSYQGFQATMTIGEVEKFRVLPGVQYIIPDSYVDLENKVYGGDKYENGVITPGPIPVPTKEGFDSVEKENTQRQEQAQRSQTLSDEGPAVQDQGSQTLPDQKSFEQGQGTLAPIQGKGQGSRMLNRILKAAHGRDLGSQMQTPRQGQGRVPSFQGSLKQSQGTLSPGQGHAIQGSQMPSFEGRFKQGQGTPPPVGQGHAQEIQRPSFQGSFKQGQGNPNVGQVQTQESHIPSSQQGYYNQGQGTLIHGQGQGQGSQIPSSQMGYSQSQGAQTPPCQGLQSNCGQGAVANYNQGSPQGNFIQTTQETYNQRRQGNYIPQSDGNYGSAQGAGSSGFGQGYSGHGQDQGGQFVSPYQGSYNQGHGIPMPGQSQGGQVPSYQMGGYSQGLGVPVPPYQGNYNQGTPINYGQWAFANHSQVPPQTYNQGVQWNFSPPNGGNYGPPQFGNQMPQYQWCYNQGQGAPFPGQWQCQRCGMPYQGSYNQFQGTPNPGQWQDQGWAMPSYQASYSHSQGASSVPPHQGNYNHGISANFNQGIPGNYSQTGQGNYNLLNGRNYGTNGSAGFPGPGQNQTFQQEDHRNVAGDPTATGKIPH
uniref:DAG protein, chloroplastic n=1 Tax=Noccaea caerulescens TaxID=107243 RepID=A0A1J3I537_NOCCA